MSVRSTFLPAFASAVALCVVACNGQGPDSSDPAARGQERPRATRIQFNSDPQAQDQIDFRKKSVGTTGRVPLNPQPGVFTGALQLPDLLGNLPIGNVELHTLMPHEVYNGDVHFAVGSQDEIYDGYILRNCSLPIDPSQLDQFGSPRYDSLKAMDPTLDEIPQPNQLRFLLKAPKNLINTPMRLELVNPKFAPGTPILQPTLSRSPIHGSGGSYDWSLPQLTYEVFMAWDIGSEWEDSGPDQVQQKIVVDTGYIPGLTDGTNDLSTSFYARVVAQDPTSAWIGSPNAEIKTVRVDFCTEVAGAAASAKALQEAQAAAVAANTAYNESNAPFSAQVVGWEPPTSIGNIPGCSSGRFVHKDALCAKVFPPYAGNPDSFWGSLSEMVGKLNTAFAKLKGWAASLAADIIVNFTPEGWVCQGLDAVAGTDCKGKMESLSKQAAALAIDAGLAAYGIPPSIPDPAKLADLSADYIAATAVDETLSQAGVSIPIQGVQDEMQNTLASQIKSNTPNMELALRLETIKNSDRAKGPWFPEPLCEEQRLAGAFSGWYTPKFTIYVRIDRKSQFVGSDHGWVVRVSPGNPKNYQLAVPVFNSVVVKIPNRWPQNLTSMVIPVTVSANFDYYASTSQLGSTEQASWYEHAWSQGQNTFYAELDLHNADLVGSTNNLAQCKAAMGIGCSGPSVFTQLTTGVTSGIGSPIKLTRECTDADSPLLTGAGSPY